MTGTHYDVLLQPDDYKNIEKYIVNPPLISTSFTELAEYGWMCNVASKWVPSYQHGKVRIEFYDPKDKTRRLLFKFWDTNRVMSLEAVMYFLKIAEFKPSYGYIYQTISKLQVALDNELQVMNFFNTLRRERLKENKKKRGLTTNSNWKSGPVFDKLGRLNPLYGEE